MVDVTDEFDRDWLIRNLANRIEELERENTDLTRQVLELREAVQALLMPPRAFPVG